MDTKAEASAVPKQLIESVIDNEDSIRVFSGISTESVTIQPLTSLT